MYKINNSVILIFDMNYGDLTRHTKDDTVKKKTIVVHSKENHNSREDSDES